jgi:mannose/fructose/N-acetylgalactosamine-specific phosphotransferase system component IIB
LKSAKVSTITILVLLKLTQDMRGLSSKTLKIQQLNANNSSNQFNDQDIQSRPETAPIYQNAGPHFEVWNNPTKPSQTALVYHTQGERYVLKEASSLEVFKDGMSLPLSQDRVQTFISAVESSNKSDLIEFLKKNLGK